MELMALPLSIDGERPNIRTRAPKLGQHNAAIPGLPRAKVRVALGRSQGPIPSVRRRSPHTLDQEEGGMT
jgi:hypothetical protein